MGAAIANPLPLASSLPYRALVVWLLRPPYVRYAAATLIILGALYLDLRPVPEVDHPFLTRDVPAGATIGPDDVEWRLLPPHTLPMVDPTGVATADLPAGTPLVPAMLTAAPSIPDDWFALEIPVPDLAAPGRPVRIVVNAETWTDGVVIALSEGSTDFLSRGRTALVAIPAGAAATVAEAAGRGSVTVLLGG